MFLGCGQVVKAADSDSATVGSNPTTPAIEKTSPKGDFFYGWVKLRMRLERSEWDLNGLPCVANQAISNYENGYSTPDIYRLVELADIFKISLDELVGREFK